MTQLERIAQRNKQMAEISAKNNKKIIPTYGEPVIAKVVEAIKAIDDGIIYDKNGKSIGIKGTNGPQGIPGPEGPPAVEVVLDSEPIVVPKPKSE